MSVSTVCRDIKELTPNAQKACEMFLSECGKQGLKVLITETYRSQQRQDYLYAQGRTAKGKKVTWTKNSRHTSRRAWDICQNIKGQEYSNTTFFRRCGEIARGLGIIWGGDWSTPDMPHFEILENWSYKGEDRMTVDERKEFDELKKEVENLKNKNVYNYIDDNMPAWARPTIQKLVEKGYLQGGDNGLNLTDELMRILVINDRAGLYD